MKLRRIGTSDLYASTIAFGAWAIGGWKWGGTDARAAVKAITAASEAGVNFIDTAPIYGFGLSEDLVGEALKTRRREAFVIATKCGLRWDIDGSNGEMLHASSTPEQPIYRSNRPASIRAECEASLTRLGTDYIDLFLTHWQDPNVPIAETMGEMLRLKEEGKIRAIGACNASPEDLAAYRAEGPLDADQELWNPLERAKSANIAASKGAAFLAYSPMAQGLLTGKIDPARVFPEGDVRHGNPKYTPDNRARVATLLDRVAPIAAAHSARIEHVFLAWTLEQGVTHALVGARNATQARSNAAAGALELTASEKGRITKAVNAFGTLL